MMYWDGGGPGSGWGIFFMSLIMLAFWGGVIGLLVYVVRQAALGQPRPGASADAKQILAERLARGEIDADEYRSRLQALSSG